MMLLIDGSWSLILTCNYRISCACFHVKMIALVINHLLMMAWMVNFCTWNWLLISLAIVNFETGFGSSKVLHWNNCSFNFWFSMFAILILMVNSNGHSHSFIMDNSNAHFWFNMVGCKVTIWGNTNRKNYIRLYFCPFYSFNVRGNLRNIWHLCR